MVKPNTNNQTEKFERLISHLGIAVVAVATVLNMTELANREGHQVVATLQPAYATVSGEHVNDTGTNELRRVGKEEIRHSSATFGAVTRSHATSGTL